jgi:hypothetical protein
MREQVLRWNNKTLLQWRLASVVVFDAADSTSSVPVLNGHDR